VERGGGLRLALAGPQRLGDLEGRGAGAVLEQVEEQLQRLERLPVEPLAVAGHPWVTESAHRDDPLERPPELRDAPQPDVDRLEQLLRPDRLGEVVVRAERHAAAHRRAVLEGGEEEEGDRPQLGDLADPLVELEPVERRHVDVADDHVGAEPVAHLGEGVAGVVEGQDGVPTLLQGALGDLQECGLVVDGQDEGGRHEAPL
jgi:hypothetical protein